MGRSGCCRSTRNESTFAVVGFVVRAGCPRAMLVQRAADIDWRLLEGVARIGITAGASAPEVLVEEVLGALAEHYALAIETVSAAEEQMFFPLPRPLRREQAAE